MDFSNYKFHASSMGYLMTDPKGKSNKDIYEDAYNSLVEITGRLAKAKVEGKSHLKMYSLLNDKANRLDKEVAELFKTKDDIELSETSKSYLVRIYCKEKYGRIDDIETDAMLKGTHAEEEGITLLSRVHKRMYKKNAEQLENEWFAGTPDIRGFETVRYSQGINGESHRKYIIDVKLSWDLFSFKKHLIGSMEDIYYWQLQAYMSLDNAQVGRLARGLVNTPQFIINNKVKQLSYRVPESQFQEAEAQLYKNMIFDDIPLRERLIMQECPRDDEGIEKMKQRVIAGRKFLQQLDTIDNEKLLLTELK